MRWPASRHYIIESFGMASPYYSGKVQSVELLGYGPLEFTNEVDGLAITLPEENTNAIAPVLAVTFDASTADEVTLATLIDIYRTKADELAAVANFNTGKYNLDKVKAFIAYLEECKQYVDADEQTVQIKKQQMAEAYTELKNNGINKGGKPSENEAEDYTEFYFEEATAFSRESGGDSRFGKPLHWTVENFMIPNGDDGVKNGLDKYTGTDCLMLGVWDDREANQEGNLANARIYRKVELEAGRYYFGATYNAAYNLTDNAYIFVADKTYSTDELPANSIAHAGIREAGTNGTFHGISFTLTEPQEVVIGFQINLLDGSATQEIRVDAIKLLYYGEMTYDALSDLILTVDGVVYGLEANSNTGFYNKESVGGLIEALEMAEKVGSDASYDEINDAYNALNEAYAYFLENGKNKGGAPSETAHEDVTLEYLVESENFSRTDPSAITRYATPAHWTVENFNIPNGNDGTKNGLDRYPGYDCLSIGIWDDRQNNTDGDISNARIYRKVQLKAGRYYFGATYNTTYNLNERAYIFASEDLLTTDEITQSSIAYYPINEAGDNDGKWHGIFFTLKEGCEVILGFQADMNSGSTTQEFRAKGVKLLYYGEIDLDKLSELIATVEDYMSNCLVNDNTGHYSPVAYSTLEALVAEAKAIDSEASMEAITAVYNRLTDGYAEFLANGRNPGGEPDLIGSADITIDKLIEASEFSRTDESVTTRYATPLHWTVENYYITTGSDGIRNGLDKYPGYDCLTLGVWDDKHANAEGDLTDARVYRKIQLDAGKYYFGASYNTIYNLDVAYMFVAAAPLPTSEIETQAIAWYPISSCGQDGKTYGLNFTLTEPSEVVVGFQADLAGGSSTKEFRAASVTLLSYTTDDSIVQVGADNSAPTYYTITGVRLQTPPTHGFYIVRQGGKAMKYIAR